MTACAPQHGSEKYFNAHVIEYEKFSPQKFGAVQYATYMIDILFQSK